MINIHIFLIAAIAIFFFSFFFSSNNYIRISSFILLYSGLLAFKAIIIPQLGSGLVYIYLKKIKQNIFFYIAIIISFCLMYLAYFLPNLYLIKHFYFYIIIIIIILSLIFYFKSYINSSIKYIYKILKNKLIKYDDSFITISEIHYSENGRYLKYVVYNNKLLDNLDVLYPIFNTLINNETFINFGYNKIIFITAIIEEQIFSFHHNVLINNDTSFENYYNKVKDIIKNHYESEGDSPSNLNNIPCFEIKIWNMDNLTNKNIKITSDARIVLNKPQHNKTHQFTQKRSYHKSNFIKPLKKVNIKTPQNLSTLDIETIEDKGFQIPCLISLTTPIESKIFLINLNILEIKPEIAINNLWKEFFYYLEHGNINFKTIFIHNLGGFDGIFLFKALSEYYKPSQLKTIIDDNNKFILITLKLKNSLISFKDSYRIFPISLDKLCELFKVKGKIFKYKQEFNNINILKNNKNFNSFIKYSKQDSKCLFNSLIKAQKEFIKLHNVDITSVVSISSLAMKIFRINYLEVDIPILNNNEDNFIRKAYYGGATDYYKAYAKNLYYYDVNSLYPKAMCNLLPYKIIKKYSNMNNVELKNFFGFCLAKIQCPENMEKPMLPLKYKNKTIFPRGEWIGTYFSEELKAVIPLGYKIELLEGIEFTKKDLFTNYVNTFYKIKMNSTGSERWISKILLNSLYGLFGRKLELLETVNIYNSDLEKYMSTNIIKCIIPINKDISTLLMIKNIDSKLIKELNNTCLIEIKNFDNSVKSNVAIAAAITAYARIHMINFKLNYDVVYTDTDSIFTTTKIDSNLIGKELGLMKQELDNLKIKEAYFLGIKQYGYWFVNSEGKKIEKSIFAGVKRNSLSFNEIKILFKGETITKLIKTRFFKSLQNLSIKIKTHKLTISKKPDKILINNNYIPITINNKNNDNLFNKLKIYLKNINKIKNKILHLLK